MKKKEQAAGFNYSDAAWLSDRTVREAVLPWCFLLDTMHMYWSNGIVSWEVNAIYRLWQEEKVGNLVDFMSLDWKTSSGQSNTLSWRKKIPTKQILQLQHTEVIRATSSVFFQFFIISSKVLWGRKDYALMPLKACGLCAASPWSCGKSRERKHPTWSICSNFKSYIIL